MSYELIAQSLPALLKGAVLTVEFAVLAMGFGLIIGALFAVMSINQYKIIILIARIYVSLIRGTPLLVQIYLVYYGLPSLGLDLSPKVAGVLTLSLNVGAYLCESLRGAVLGITRGQWYAAYSLGLSHLQTLRYIITPQALRISLPSLGNSLISLIKDTSLVSLITVTELMHNAKEIISITYQPFALYIIVAIIYWLLSASLATVQHFLEHYFSKKSINIPKQNH